jgi:branched-chain amino acid transport system substrate-binding protein
MDPVKTKLATLTLSAIALSLGATSAQAQQQGVSKNEIVIGTIQDLSGPIAAFGKQIRNGMQLRIDELNEQNGVAGRKIKLIVEDSAYDPKKAVLAAQKLVNSDKVFVVAGHLGTAQNNAAIPVQLEKNVMNFFPVTASREMFDPFHRLKFAFAATYFDQMKSGLPQMFANKKYAKPCIIYQDDDFGLEVLRGAEESLKNIGVPLAEKTSYKRGSTDFSSQVAKMKSTGCDLVILGTIIRETIGTIGESRKTGFAPDFFGSSAAYTDIIHKLGGPAMNGLYAMHTVGHPYPDDASPAVSFWAKKYKTKFNEDGTVFSAYGYVIVDQLATAMAAAGTNLTTDTLVKAIETTKFSADIFGGKAPTFSPTKRLGSSETRMSQIKNGKWTVVSEYLAVPK